MNVVTSDKVAFVNVIQIELSDSCIKKLADALKQKTGKWIGDKCSVCGEERAWYGCNPKYCPDCGARMENEP